MTRDEVVACVPEELKELAGEALDLIWKISPNVLVVDCKVVGGILRMYLGLMPIKHFSMVYDVVRDMETKSIKIIERKELE